MNRYRHLIALAALSLVSLSSFAATAPSTDPTLTNYYYSTENSTDLLTVETFMRSDVENGDLLVRETDDDQRLIVTDNGFGLGLFIPIVFEYPPQDVDLAPPVYIPPRGGSACADTCFDESAAVAVWRGVLEAEGQCDISISPSGSWIVQGTGGSTHSPPGTNLLEQKNFDVSYGAPNPTTSECDPLVDQIFTMNRWSQMNCPSNYSLAVDLIPPDYGSCNPPATKPTIIKDIEPGEKTACTGDPCNPALGTFFDAEQDYAGTTLSFTRHYLSSQQENPQRAIAPGWVHNYSRSIRMRTNGRPDYLTRPDGQLVFLRRTGDFFTGMDSGGRLEQTQTEFIYHLSNGVREFYNLAGRLKSIDDGSGKITTLSYNAIGKLNTVTGPFGRTLSFMYDANNRLIAVEDPAAEAITYTYDEDNGNLLSVTYPDLTTRSYQYNNPAFPNHLTAIIDENAKTENAITYDAFGRVTSLQGANGADRVDLVYNIDNSTTVTEANGRSTIYDFDETAEGRLPNAFTGGLCAQCNIDYQARDYDVNGNTVSQTDFNGNVTTFARDSRGREISRTEAVGSTEERTISTSWNDSVGKRATITEPGRTTAFIYDSSGNVLTQTVTDTTTSEARITTFTYTLENLLASIDGPRTDVTDITTFTYDLSGNLSTTVNALTQTTQITQYDAHGNPLQITDANGVITSLVYDLRQRLTTRTVAFGTAESATTTFTYDDAGLLTRTTLPNGAFIDYGYDDAQRLISIEDNLGNRIDYTLDDLGNRTNEAVSDPGGLLVRSQQRVFDSLNRLQQSIGGELQTTSFEYDDNSNRTAIVDALNQRTENSYDALDRLTSVLDAALGTTQYQYDALDNLTQVIDPRGVTTNYSYNAFGDLLATDSKDAGLTSYTYDEAGNRLTQTDARGVTASFAYDALNRLASISYPTATKNISYLYDQGVNGIGRLSSITDETGTTDYTYDARGNLLGKTSTINGIALVNAYSYDAADNLIGITYPDGSQVSYVRDAAGRITDISHTDVGGTLSSTIAAVTYQPFGGIEALSFGNGLSHGRTYDQDGRLTSLLTTGVQDRTYTYDVVNNIIGITNNLDTSRSQSFSYDALYRLTNASGVYGNLAYAYDAVGNRTQLTDNGAVTSYAYALDSNRLSTVTDASGVASYLYDAVGNTLDNGANQFTYDDRNRMVTAADVTGGAFDYTQNSLGQRVSKPRFGSSEPPPPPEPDVPGDANGDGIITEDDLHALHDALNGLIPTTPAMDCNEDGVINNKDNSCIAKQIGDQKNNGNNSEPDPESTTEPDPQTVTTNVGEDIVGEILFVYDEAGHLIGEYDEIGTPIRQYIWLGDMPVGMINADGTFYVHTDHLNTPQALTDSAGAIVWAADYKPFGEVTETVTDVEFNLRFPGQYADTENGLNYNYFRSYNPGIGRYTQSDPIGIYGGFNLYQYVNSNPANMYDPWGLLAYPASCTGIGCYFIFGGPFGPICGPSDQKKVAAWIPDGPFSEGCRIHDKCYLNCSRRKIGCDLDLYTNTNFLYFVGALGERAQEQWDKAREEANCNDKNMVCKK